MNPPNKSDNYECNQQDATIQINLLFLVSSTCFGRCFRPSSGTLDCIYSIWYYSLKWLPDGVLVELELISSSSSNSTKALASGDVFAHHQEHLTLFTVSGIIHSSGYQTVSWLNWNSFPVPVPTQPRH